jgi:hypothetical protein
MKVAVDKFEGDFVICRKEDHSILNINRRDVPIEAKEGDVLNIDGDTVTIDIVETSKRKEMARLLAVNVWDINDLI